MNAAELAALLAFCTAMSFSPGPNTTLSTAMAANHGLRHALRFCFAVPAGWTLVMVLSAAGLGAAVASVPVLRLAIQVFGCAYLVWLAWKLAGAGRFGSADGRRLDVGFLQGVGLQFVNVKAWMLALTISAGWVVSTAGVPTANPWERLAQVCAIVSVFAFVSNFSYAAAGSLLRGWLSQGTRLLWFNRLLALVLLGTAAWMALA
ncbi:MAG TPA: LysE family translocator [Ramlibacter sp.]|jgi:threonine/homoserine/homoserine lactone efflux protein|uniref:LysE family translocator n=1 Tax=Ramlibacter sp. TaxID=1917967 RepID=UPI002D6E787C|nr:LysE family translocator [Ramlibacter sp.]HZY16982.1 LysE family translocator [Ramlibacter sp.]